MKGGVDRALAIIAIVVAIVMGLPAWLPLFGVTSDAFSNFVNSDLYRFVPWVCLVLGLFAGFILAGRLRPFHRLKERQYDAAIARRCNAEARAKNREYVMHLSMNKKSLLKLLSLGEKAYCQNDKWSLERNLGPLIGPFIQWEVVSDFMIRLSATEDLKAFAADNGDLLDVVSDLELEKRAKYDPERNNSWGYISCGDEMYWWWYSNDPNFCSEKMFARERGEENEAGSLKRALGLK